MFSFSLCIAVVCGACYILNVENPDIFINTIVKNISNTKFVDELKCLSTEKGNFKIYLYILYN